MEHKCSESNRLLRIEKILDGNGQPGMITTVATIKEKINEMEGSLDSLASSFKALAQSQLEFDITEKLKIESKNKKYKVIQILGICVAVVVSLFEILDFIKG